MGEGFECDTEGRGEASIAVTVAWDAGADGREVLEIGHATAGSLDLLHVVARAGACAYAFSGELGGGAEVLVRRRDGAASSDAVCVYRVR